jgi:ribosomal-protein-alanine N-acetyltransferase
MTSNVKLVEEINIENLFLRKITKDDADFVFKSLNDKRVTAYLSIGPLMTLEQSKRLIKSYLNYWNAKIQFNYIIELIEADRVKIGSASLWSISWQNNRAQIGIWLVHSFWDKGLGEIALNLIKNIAFNHLKLNRLEAYIAVKNKRSIFLFEKCGFKEEGRLKQYLNFQGKYYDAVILACIKKNSI